MKLILEDTRPRRPRFEKDKGREGEKMKGYRERDRESSHGYWQHWTLRAICMVAGKEGHHAEYGIGT